MKTVVTAIILVSALGLAGCAGSSSPGGVDSGRGSYRLHGQLLGVTAQVPPGWSARGARLGNSQLRVDLVATSFPIPRTRSRQVPIGPSWVCRTNGSSPPPGGVAILLYEHPSFAGARVAHLQGWFPSRPDHLHLGNPGNEEGYYGFNLFFQDRGRALQAQVCLRRGSRFGERRRRQTERFLDSVSFSAPRPDPIGWGSATKTCHGVFAGSGERGWRRQAADAGPFGFSGAGQDFRRIPRRERDGLFHTKMPALVDRRHPAGRVRAALPGTSRCRSAVRLHSPYGLAPPDGGRAIPTPTE